MDVEPLKSSLRIQFLVGYLKIRSAETSTRGNCVEKVPCQGNDSCYHLYQVHSACGSRDSLWLGEAQGELRPLRFTFRGCCKACKVKGLCCFFWDQSLF